MPSFWQKPTTWEIRLFTTPSLLIIEHEWGQIRMLHENDQAKSRSAYVANLVWGSRFVRSDAKTNFRLPEKTACCSGQEAVNFAP